MIRKIILILVLVVFTCQLVIAQGVSLSPKKKLTKGDNLPESVTAAWTGKEWGAFYCITGGGFEYLRVKKQGKVLNRTTVFTGSQEVGKYTYSYVKPCWGGGSWGLIVTKARWSDTQKKDGIFGYNESHFLCLDKSGSPVGDTLYLNGGFGGEVICLGDFFLVFYKGPYAGEISAAKVDLNGKQIGESQLILDMDSENSVAVEDAIVTKKGVIVLYFVKNRTSGEKYSGFLTLGFNNKVVENPKILPDVGIPFHASHIRWTGKAYIISGYQLWPGGYNDQSIAALGLADVNGQWELYPEEDESIEDDYKGSIGDRGIAYDGHWMYNFYVMRKHCYVWGKSDDGKSKRERLEFFNYASYFGGSVVPVSDMTGLFLINFYRLNNKLVSKAFYRRFTMEHTGKPQPVVLEGKIHNVDGKKYAALTWHIKGCDKVIIRAAGRSVTMPAYGWLAWKVNNSTIPFTVIGRNKSGKFKTVYKVK